MVDARSVCIALGAIFIAIGVLGFTENPLTGASGLFVTHTAHDLVHIFTGAGFLFGAIRFPGHARTTVKIWAGRTRRWQYGIPLARHAAVRPGPDRWLHLVLAAGILALASVTRADSDSLRQSRLA